MVRVRVGNIKSLDLIAGRVKRRADRLWGTRKSSVRCVSGVTFPAVMRMERDTGHLPLSCAEAKNDRNLPSLRHVFRDNFGLL